MTKVIRKVSQQVRIPGFRPGKAPRAIVERTVGQPMLLQEAIEDLLPTVYNEALESESISTRSASPRSSSSRPSRWFVQATVPVRPTIEIGAYEALRVPRDEVSAGETETDEALTDLRRRYATLEPVDRAVEWNDTVRIDMTVSIEGQAEPHVEEGAEFAVTEGGIVSLPGFLDLLIGLERGGPHEFSFDLPEDYPAEELAGKTAGYSVQLLEVKQEVLPELDDEFARSLDEEGIDNLEQLQARVSEGVQAQIEAVADMSYREEVVDLLLATAELDYPEVLVEREIDRLVDEQSQHAAHEREDFERWLEAIGRTEDEVRDALREQADLSRAPRPRARGVRQPRGDRGHRRGVERARGRARRAGLGRHDRPRSARAGARDVRHGADARLDERASGHGARAGAADRGSPRSRMRSSSRAHRAAAGAAAAGREPTTKPTKADAEADAGESADEAEASEDASAEAGAGGRGRLRRRGRRREERVVGRRRKPARGPMEREQHARRTAFGVGEDR